MNCNITPRLSLRQRRGYLELIVVVRGFIVKVVPRFVGHAIIDVSRGRGATAASRRDTGGEARFGGDHSVGTLGTTRGSSAGGRGRRRLSRRSVASEGATGLDVTWGPLETSGALVERAVDADVSEFPAVEAGLMVTGMVAGQRDVMVTAGPPDVGAF